MSMRPMVATSEELLSTVMTSFTRAGATLRMACGTITSRIIVT